MADKLVKDVVKVTKRVVGKSILVGNRSLIPLLEYTFYGKHLPGTDGSATIFISVIIKPISFQVSEDKNEWKIEI